MDTDDGNPLFLRKIYRHAGPAANTSVIVIDRQEAICLIHQKFVPAAVVHYGRLITCSYGNCLGAVFNQKRHAQFAPVIPILPQEKIGMYLAEAERRGLLAAFYLELTTGLRRGELLALLWTDMDTEARTISVTKQVNRIKGDLVVSPPKTQNSVRTLVIPQQAVDLLIEEHKKHPGNPYMFPSPKTGTMYDPDAFRRTHDKILKAIGAEHVRFHDMRHLFATLSLKNGVDVKTLSGALGHYSAGFTLNTYTHATTQMKQDAADTIGAVISSQM